MFRVYAKNIRNIFTFEFQRHLINFKMNCELQFQSYQSNYNNIDQIKPKLQIKAICKQKIKINFESDKYKIVIVHQAYNHSTIPLSIQCYYQLKKNRDIVIFQFIPKYKTQIKEGKIGQLQIYSSYPLVKTGKLPFVFLQSFEQKLIGIVPIQQEEYYEQVIDGTSKKIEKKMIVYDWQAYFTGLFEMEYYLEDVHYRAFQYKILQNTQSQNIGYLVDKLKHQKIMISNSNNTCQLILASSHKLNQHSIYRFYNNCFKPLLHNFFYLNLITNGQYIIFFQQNKTQLIEGIHILPNSYVYQPPPVINPPIIRDLLQTFLMPYFSQKWIIEGIAGYIEIRSKILWTRQFSLLWDKLMKDIQKGQQLPYYISQQRAIVLIHMITELTNECQKFAKTLIEKSQKENIKIGNHQLFKIIKNNYGIKNLKYFSQQFVKSTGAVKVHINFHYSKKDHKISLNCFQKPVQMDYFLFYNQIRIKLNDYFETESQLVEKLKNKQRDKERGGCFAVPNILKSQCFYEGIIKTLLAETNQIQYKQYTSEIKLEKKSQSIGYIIPHNKLTKNPVKKDKDQVPVHAVNHLPNRLPGWIKFDPDRCFLFNVEMDSSNQNEYILLRQLAKQKNDFQLFRVLQSTKKYPTQNIIKQLLTMVQLKESPLSKAVKIQIVDILPSLFNGKNQKIQSLLFEILKGLCIHQDTILPNFYASVQLYIFRLTLIKVMTKFKRKKVGESFIEKIGQSYFNQQIVQFLLRLIKQNDNSINKKDDSEYLTTIMQTLLSFKNSKSIIYILQQAQKFLQMQRVTNSYQHSIGCKIVEKVFVTIKDSNLLKNEKEFYEHKFKKLVKDLKSIDAIKLNYLKQKLNQKQKSYSHLQFFIYAMQKLQKIYMQRYNIYVQLLKYTKLLFLKNRKKWALDIQIDNTIQKNYLIAQMLWDKIDSNQSFENQTIEHLWIGIYKIFYFYFCPIAVLAYFRKYSHKITHQQFKKCTKDFTISKEWFFNFYLEKQVNLINDQNDNELKIKKIKPQNQMIPIDGTEDQMKYFIERNPQRANWIQLSKALIDKLLKLNPEFQITKAQSSVQGNTSITIKAPIHLRQIRKKLKKGCVPKGYDLQQIQKDIRLAMMGKQGENKLDEMFSKIHGVIESLQMIKYQ